MAAKRKSFATRRKSEPAAVTDAQSFDLKAAALNFGERTGISRTTVFGFALGVLTLAVYAQVWNFDFITIDDPNYSTINPHVLYGLSLPGIKWAFTKFYMANWMPLTWISFMLDASVYQSWAGGYHITNVILHVANVLLVFHVIRKATGRESMSALVAALFAVHPIHAESVAWISERKDVLSIFFGLLSLSAYLSYVQQKRKWWYWASLALFGTSLLAKQTLVTLPCVLLLLDYWPLGRLSVRTVVEKAPFFVISLVISVVAVLAQANGQTVRSLESVPFALRLATAAIGYASYLQKAIIPWNLGVYYPYSSDVSLWRVAVSIAVIVMLTAAAVWSRRRYPFVTVGWFWFLGTLVPMIGLVQVGMQQMADRYAYFPFIGLYLALAGFVTSGRVAIALVGVAAVLGFIQVGYWRDTLTLAEHTLQVTDDNAFMHYTLGDALAAEGRVDDALQEFRKPLLIEPGNASNYCKLGEAFIRFNRLDQARRPYEIAVGLDDGIAAAHAGLGWLHLQNKQIASAKREFERALELDNGDQYNYFNLALVCEQTHDFEGSINYCRRALKVNDYLVAAHHLIVDNLRRQGRTDEANAELRYVLTIAPYDDQAREMLGK
jgi:protein O-mannosyl-transferase